MTSTSTPLQELCSCRTTRCELTRVTAPDKHQRELGLPADMRRVQLPEIIGYVKKSLWLCSVLLSSRLRLTRAGTRHCRKPIFINLAYLEDC